jgi:hypothetical protein
MTWYIQPLVKTWYLQQYSAEMFDSLSDMRSCGRDISRMQIPASLYILHDSKILLFCL